MIPNGIPLSPSLSNCGSVQDTLRALIILPTSEHTWASVLLKLDRSSATCCKPGCSRVRRWAKLGNLLNSCRFLLVLQMNSQQMQHCQQIRPTPEIGLVMAGVVIFEPEHLARELDVLLASKGFFRDRLGTRWR